MNGKNRSYVMGVAGGYLLYLAYQLFENFHNPEAGMSPAVRVIFIALFVLLGIGLMVYAFRIWKEADREEKAEKEQQKTTVPDDETAMK